MAELHTETATGEEALFVSRVPVAINARITFFGLEIEELILSLGAAMLFMIVGRFVDRQIFGMSLSTLLTWGVPGLIISYILGFRAGKARGYFPDLMTYHLRPRIYCAAEHDEILTNHYILEENDAYLFTNTDTI